MIKEAKVRDTLYQIDTTPTTAFGHEGRFAEIYEVLERPARSGKVESVLRELGKEPVIRSLALVNSKTEREIVLALGRKFSTSRAWRNLYNYYIRQR